MADDRSVRLVTTVPSVYHRDVRRLVRYLVVMVAVVAAALFLVAMPYVDALAFIARAADMGGPVSHIADLRAQAFVVEPVQQIPTRHGLVDSRIYRPANGMSRRAVTLVPGVHLDGIREARLVGMAEDLAASGFTVLTVATPDLQRYLITPRSTDIIEDAATWLYARGIKGHATDGAVKGGAEGGTSVPPDETTDTNGDGKIGMLGISFSGGLSIVAAGRPDLRDKVSFVMSFGGHGDLPRVMRYLCSGNAPAMPPPSEATDDIEGAEHLSIRPPHDYGVAVVLLGVADRLVPVSQVEALRKGIMMFLAASSIDVIDKPRAEIEFARARAYADTLPEPSRTLMTHVNNRAVAKLGPLLLPMINGDAGAVAALSPERAPAPTAPVFLLHGVEDNVIPPIETVLLTHYLHDKTEVHAVLSGLITHAEVDRDAAAIEVWRLVGFWRSLMSQ